MKATRESARQTAKDMQAQGKLAGEFFGGVKDQALGLMAVLIGGKGVSALVQETVTSLAAMGRSAQNIGIGVPELASFRNTVEANGGSAEAAAASFQHLADQMAELKATGTNAILPGLNMIGGQRGETAMQTYMRFVAFAASHKNDIGLTRLVGHRLGLDEGSINEALKGTVQVAKDLADATKRGVPTGPMTERMAALQGAFFKAEQAAGHLVDVLVDRLAPGLTAMLQGITAFIEAHPDLSTAIGIGAGVAGPVVASKVVMGVGRSIVGGGAKAAELAAKLAASEAAAAAAAAASAASAAAGGALTAGGGALTAGAASGTALTTLGVVGAFIARWSPWLTALWIMKPGGTNSAEMDEEARRLGGGGGKRVPDNTPEGPVPGTGPGQRRTAPSGPVDRTAPDTSSREAFISSIMPKAQAESERTGVDARIIAAQAALESGYGRHAPNNNYFGVKGPGGMQSTQEFEGGRMVTKQQSFAGYPNAGASFEGYGDFINRNPRYAEMRTAKGIDAQIAALGRSGYATDPDYASKISGIVRTIQTAQPQRQFADAGARDNKASSADGGTGGGDQHVTISGPINIHTQATDAKGIAGSLRRELGGKMATMANTGLA